MPGADKIGTFEPKPRFRELPANRGRNHLLVKRTGIDPPGSNCATLLDAKTLLGEIRKFQYAEVIKKAGRNGLCARRIVC
jgi:hypothetical protein